jgi:hypothetical protein
MSEPKFKVGDMVMTPEDGMGKVEAAYEIDGIYNYRIRVKGATILTLGEGYKKANNFVDYVCNKLDEVKELFRRKNQQYSVGADPLANFRAGALLRAGNDSYAEMYEEAKNYRRKHVVHIERNGIDADKGDESLDDIIVYSAIMAYMRYCHEQEQSNG